jgi:hypothetical protein
MNCMFARNARKTALSSLRTNLSNYSWSKGLVELEKACVYKSVIERARNGVTTSNRISKEQQILLLISTPI